MRGLRLGKAKTLHSPRSEHRRRFSPDKDALICYPCQTRRVLNFLQRLQVQIDLRFHPAANSLQFILLTSTINKQPQHRMSLQMRSFVNTTARCVAQCDDILSGSCASNKSETRQTLRPDFIHLLPF